MYVNIELWSRIEISGQSANKAKTIFVGIDSITTTPHKVNFENEKALLWLAPKPFGTTTLLTEEEESSNDDESVIVFTDVGEEIDDEIALYWLFRSRKVVSPSSDLTLVFTRGALGADLDPAGRHAKFRDYFPDAPDYVTCVDDLTGLADTIRGKHYSKMLQIAPLRGVPDAFFRNNTFGVRYLMGHLDVPSVNTCKTFGNNNKRDDYDEHNNAQEGLWAEYEAQSKALAAVPTIEIRTTLCRSVPLTASILAKLPPLFRDQIFHKAYEQFVGRVPASLPHCYTVTFEANYPTLMAYVSSSSRLHPSFETYQRLHHDSEHVQRLATGFYDSIAQKPPLGGAKTANGEEDLEKLKDMILVVEFMTGGRYSDESLQKGNEKFKGYDTGLTAWKEKVENHKCSLTPAYDLLAMYAMVKGLSQEELTLEHSKALRNKLEEAFDAL